MGVLSHRGPGVHVAGRDVRFDWLLPSESGPLGASLKANVPDPSGESTLIQYGSPEVMVAAGTVTVFQAPLVGEEIVPPVRRLPG